MPVKYQAYPEYKNAGINWLDEIPVDWEIMQLKRTVDGCTNGIWGSEPNNDGNDTIVLRVADFDRPRLSLQDDGYTYRNIEDKEKVTRRLKYGDLLLEKSGGGEKTLVGQVVLFDKEFEAVTSNFVAKMTPNSGFNSRFLNYVFSRFYNENINYCSIKQNTGIQNLDSAAYLAEKFGFPQEGEQDKIANFLDHETAKIDTLIEKQQQLIKLLKEKRQAVISHAVTKGLNPNAPMRDSGVKWLGEVPEHWEMVPLKYLCKFSGGGTPSKDNLSYWNGGNIPWVSPKDMKTFWVSETQDKLTERAVEESSTSYVEEGALLMVVRSGILQRTIPIAINTVRVTLNQDMKALKFNERMNAEYAANYIIGNVSSLLLEWSKEGATVESIEQEYLSGSLMPIPPLDEQVAINEELKMRMTVFQSLEDCAAKGIALLQERRTALISAAVTGKIDVRNWQAPEPSNPAKNNNKEVAA